MSSDQDRPRPPAEDTDLSWLFRCSAGDIGFSSWAGTMGGGRSASTDGDGRIVRRGLTALKHESRSRGEPAITRLRRLEGALARLAAEQRTVLWMAYARHQVHLQARRKLGTWPGVLLLTRRIRNAYEEWVEREAAKHAAKVDEEHFERCADAELLERTNPNTPLRRIDHDAHVREYGRHIERGVMALRSTTNVGQAKTLPSVTEWVLERAPAKVLRCGQQSCPGACAVHEAEELVTDAWGAWVSVSGRVQRERMPKSFYFDRNAPENQP